MAGVPLNILTRLAAMVQHAFAVFRARETPLYVKILLAGGLLYAVSPYDLIPEWIPVVGLLDDLALAALLIAWANSFRVSANGRQRSDNGDTDERES
jgi:uncharacterized membrane protein YkvA (DUF1232 family)